MPGQAFPHDDETTLLLAYIDQQRDGIRHAAYGLTDEQARSTPTAGALSIGGLVRHVAHTERQWIEMIAGQPAAGRDEAAYFDSFGFGPDDRLADALAELDVVAAETEATVAGLAMDTPVPVPKGVPWFPADIDAWSVRWVLLHLIEEIGRHAGHADIVRESIDGATMYELMAGAEGWPATDWLTPWAPSEAVSS